MDGTLPCLAVYKDGDCWRPIRKDMEGPVEVYWIIQGEMTPVFRDEWRPKMGGGSMVERKLVALRFDVG
jgi:hypothetical protein